MADLLSHVPRTLVGPALLAAAALTVFFIAYSLIEARRLRVVTDSIERPDLPTPLDGIRIVFVADVHAGPFFGKRNMDALVCRVNALEPDVLLLGGDYVGGRAGGARVFYPAVGRFTARLAKVAVLGNHDVWEGAERALRGLTDAGFVVLLNENLEVHSPEGARLRIGGVEDLYAGCPDVVEAARGIDPSEFAVLVSHNPDVFATQLERTPKMWDLALAGHTHAGQITLFGRWAAIVPSKYGQRYRTGWSEEAGVKILVSGGVGTVTLPLRFFARPEIHAITLRRR